MSPRLDMRESQIRALIRAARKEGARLEVKMGQTLVTVIPESNTAVSAQLDHSNEAFLDAELAAFEAEHGGH